MKMMRKVRKKVKRMTVKVKSLEKEAGKNQFQLLNHCTARMMPRDDSSLVQLVLPTGMKTALVVVKSSLVKMNYR